MERNIPARTIVARQPATDRLFLSPGKHEFLQRYLSGFLTVLSTKSSETRSSRDVRLTYGHIGISRGCGDRRGSLRKTDKEKGGKRRSKLARLCTLFVRFDIHLEIEFNFPVGIPPPPPSSSSSSSAAAASQRSENRESLDEGETKNVDRCDQNEKETENERQRKKEGNREHIKARERKRKREGERRERERERDKEMAREAGK